MMAGGRKWAAAGIGVVVLGAALAPWTFSGTAVRQEIARQVSETVGLIMEGQGRTTLALLPRPRIKVSDVVIRDRDGTLRMQAGLLRGDLRILPIFAGRLELSSVTLVEPQLDIDIDAKPLASDSAIVRAAEARPASPEAEIADGTRLGQVSIQHGSAHIRSASRSLDAQLQDLDLTLDWRSLREPAGVKVNFRWNDEAVEVAAWVGKPADLLRGDNSPVSVKIDSPSLVLSANGSVFGLGGLRYQGKVSATAPSLARLATFGGFQLPLPGPLQKFSLVGSARTTSNTVALSDLRMSLDGNAFDGALIYSTEHGRPSLSGTLATDLLNIASLPDETPAGLSGREDALGQAVTSDADLRVSASKLRLGRLQAKDVGFSLQINGGKAELSIVEAAFYGGLIKGRIRSEPSPGGMILRSNLGFAKLDTAALLAEGLRSQRLSGEANGELALSAEGDTLPRILASLAGSVQMTLSNGELAGLDLEQALRRLEKRPLSIASEMRTGRTAFTLADLKLSVERGEITVRQAEVRGPGVEFSVGGTASIPARSLDLSIRAQTTTTTPSTRNRPQLAIDVTGSWDDPNLDLDAQSIIRRSEAAAPLLRSLAPPVARPPVEPAKGDDN